MKVETFHELFLLGYFTYMYCVGSNTSGCRSRWIPSPRRHRSPPLTFHRRRHRSLPLTFHRQRRRRRFLAASTTLPTLLPPPWTALLSPICPPRIAPSCRIPLAAAAAARPGPLTTLRGRKVSFAANPTLRSAHCWVGLRYLADRPWAGSCR